jgi:hypothetical protein
MRSGLKNESQLRAPHFRLNHTILQTIAEVFSFRRITMSEANTPKVSKIEAKVAPGKLDNAVDAVIANLATIGVSARA